MDSLIQKAMEGLIHKNQAQDDELGYVRMTNQFELNLNERFKVKSNFISLRASKKPDKKPAEIETDKKPAEKIENIWMLHRGKIALTSGMILGFIVGRHCVGGGKAGGGSGGAH